MNDNERFEDLIPAYTLGALDPEACAELEARLATDEAARNLLADYEQVAGELIYALPARELPTHRASHMAGDLRQRLQQARPPAESLSPQKRQVRWRAWAVAAAAVLVILIGAVLVLSQANRGAPDKARIFAALQAQAESVRVAVIPAEEQEQLSGQLVAADDGSRAVIQVQGLPELAADQTFQLWMRDVDGVVESGGLFLADASEATYIEIPLAGRPLDRFAGFGVSLEPAGGSPYPDRRSGPQVFAVPLPQDS